MQALAKQGPLVNGIKIRATDCHVKTATSEGGNQGVGHWDLASGARR